jgi:hypothetical protein
MLTRALAAAITLALLWAAASNAAEPLKPVRTPAPPVIDGDLSDLVWQSAPTVTGFKTYTPDYGKDMRDRTIVYYAHDAENLYFAFRAFDGEPGRIKASIAARDGINADDWICINLDSFGDQQSLYALYVNPLGIQGDSRFAAGREDFGFDAVWYSAGRIDSDGYTIEVRIPFKSLRYRNDNPVRMALIFERHVSRRSEHGTYPPLDPKVGPNFLTQNVPIEFRDIRRYKLVEVLPDVVYSYQQERTANELERVDGGPEAGLTTKYGLTPDLVFDGAVNPDFSQVEADAGQIDINRRYALFFPEKRPFFLEGRDSFNYTGADYSPMQSVVHTRTIGNPIAGARLTGKVAPADSIAAIYAVDELSPDAVEAGAPEYAQVSIVRYKHGLKGDAYLGGFYTGREEGDAFNRVCGGDGSLRLTQASTLGFYAFGSSTRPHGGDTTGGHSVLANYAHTNRKLNVYLQALDISEGFETWTGYLTRAGVFQASALISPRFYPESGVLRRVEPMFIADYVRDAPSGLWEQWYDGTLTLVLPRSGRVSAKYHWSNEIYESEDFDTSGVQVQASGQLTKELRLQGTFAHQNAIYYSADPFAGRSTSATAAVIYQPTEQWLFDLRGTYQGFSQASDGRRLYDYGIYRGKATYQFNRYLFFRGIAEYNTYRRQLLTDFLASFTYIPGTVFHVGYGSLYEKLDWQGDRYVPGRDFLETRRGFFLKASYLWRL